MSDADSPRVIIGEPAPGDRIGDYVVLDRLARGGMATVLSVRHTESQEEVALKLLLSLALTDESQGRFRREFRALSRLHHPNVLRVYEWGLLGDRPWFTMERLEGHDLREEVGLLEGLPLSERFARAEDILKQVARALAYVHERGLVHRDVTPGNIFVLQDGTVKLMDFGVVKEAGADLTAAGEVIGTIAYMAPEQITGEGIDSRADLYSLGAVLYLLLTGRRAFSAHTIHGFMEKHLNARPRPPSELVPAVPARLEAICLRLLQKAPSDRFASASHLLHVLGDLEHGFDLEGQFPRRTVGRTLLKARLREAVDAVAHGREGRALLLSGPNGQGKTRLLEVAEHHARRLGLPVATGRCRHHDRPFGAFSSIYQAFRGDAPPAALEAVFRGDDGQVWERYPILSAFRELVIASAPLVLILDDLDRADPATVELLCYLVRNTLELVAEPVLLLIGHDSGERRIRAQLESLAPVEGLEIPPLDASEVEELVVSLIGSNEASLALAARLHVEGNGSPALIADMLRGLMDDELIVKEDTGSWRLVIAAAEITRSRLPMPASLRQALQERLAPLSEDALVVGRVLAHARNKLNLDVLVAAAPFEEEQVVEALDELLDAGIVQEQRAEDIEQVELCHGRFREVLADGVPPATRRGIHLALGETLERQHRDHIHSVVEELAYHFEHAQLATKAYQYLVLTAQHHLHRSLNQEALGFLDRAVAIEPRARPYMLLDDADQRLAEVHLAIAQARHALGQLPSAVAATQLAQALARAVRDPGLESRVASELGSQLRQQGSSESAEEQCRLAIQRAEEAGDQRLLPRPLYQLGGILWTQGDLGEAERMWRRSLQIAQQVGDERAQGNGYNGLAILAICRGQSMEARRWFEQSATLFERLGMLAPLVIARVNLIELYLNTGILRKALALADRTLSQAKEVGHPQGIALGKGWRARVLLTLGRATEAEREAREAWSHVRGLANREDEALILGTRTLICLDAGRWSEALELIVQLLDVLDIYDHEGIGPEVTAWQALALCQLERHAEAQALLEALPSRPEPWPHIQIRADLALGQALLALQQRPGARSALQRALAASEANGYRYFQLVAHSALVRAVDDESTRTRHARVASGLARSLAANLPRDDVDRFLRAHDGPGAAA
ncbi:MAG TPA: tetratricopeptide repeat protein [Deltaproteobacteria bacterium]|nr:tetratricopeptide repeat protein [Deltaproteobacteria bacterium]